MCNRHWAKQKKYIYILTSFPCVQTNLNMNLIVFHVPCSLIKFAHELLTFSQSIFNDSYFFAFKFMAKLWPIYDFLLKIKFVVLNPLFSLFRTYSKFIRFCFLSKKKCYSFGSMSFSSAHDFARYFVPKVRFGLFFVIIILIHFVIFFSVSIIAFKKYWALPIYSLPICEIH